MIFSLGLSQLHLGLIHHQNSNPSTLLCGYFALATVRSVNSPKELDRLILPSRKLSIVMARSCLIVLNKIINYEYSGKEEIKLT